MKLLDEMLRVLARNGDMRMCFALELAAAAALATAEREPERFKQMYGTSGFELIQLLK
jgi:hypothetical protein